jgi:hypothetical protein
MKNLDLYKLWHICNKLSQKQGELEEEGQYFYLLGVNSNFIEDSFDKFLKYYSFKIENKQL